MSPQTPRQTKQCRSELRSRIIRLRKGSELRSRVVRLRKGSGFSRSFISSAAYRPVIAVDDKINPANLETPRPAMNDYTRRIVPPVSASNYLRTGNLPWEETSDKGFRLKRLYEDEARGEKTWLMKVDPGAHAPSHAHEEFEQFYVLDGSIEDDHGTMRAGDFVCRPPGEMHWAASGTGALVLLVYTRHDPL